MSGDCPEADAYNTVPVGESPVIAALEAEVQRLTEQNRALFRGDQAWVKAEEHQEALAQVAVLAEALRNVQREYCSACGKCHLCAKVEPPLASLPARARQMLAAQRVCDVLIAKYAPSLKHAGPLVDAVDEYLRAKGE